MNDDLYEVEQVLIDNPPRKSDAMKHTEACVKDNHPFIVFIYYIFFDPSIYDATNTNLFRFPSNCFPSNFSMNIICGHVTNII